MLRSTTQASSRTFSSSPPRRRPPPRPPGCRAVRGRSRRRPRPGRRASRRSRLRSPRAWPRRRRSRAATRPARGADGRSCRPCCRARRCRSPSPHPSRPRPIGASSLLAAPAQRKLRHVQGVVEDVVGEPVPQFEGVERHDPLDVLPDPGAHLLHRQQALHRAEGEADRHELPVLLRAEEVVVDVAVVAREQPATIVLVEGHVLRARRVGVVGRLRTTPPAGSRASPSTRVSFPSLQPVDQRHHQVGVDRGGQPLQPLRQPLHPHVVLHLTGLQVHVRVREEIDAAGVVEVVVREDHRVDLGGVDADPARAPPRGAASR